MNILAQIDWPQVANYGLPAILLIGFSGAVWKASNWLAVEVIKPVVKSHIDYINESIKALKDMQDAMREFQETQREHLTICKAHAESTPVIH